MVRSAWESVILVGVVCVGSLGAQNAFAAPFLERAAPSLERAAPAQKHLGFFARRRARREIRSLIRKQPELQQLYQARRKAAALPLAERSARIALGAMTALTVGALALAPISAPFVALASFQLPALMWKNNHDMRDDVLADVAKHLEDTQPGTLGSDARAFMAEKLQQRGPWSHGKTPRSHGKTP